jgi:DNA replication licensing factor MCM6
MDTSKMQRKAQKSMDGVAGLRGAGVKDLSYKMVFIASSVHTGDTRFAFNQGSYAADDEEAEKDINKMFTMQERHEVTRMKQEDNLYQKLAKSIAPSVYGHLDIKKGIQKKTKEGIKLRGDINICIVGDPATAKSQFLKYICSFISFLIFK